MSIVDRLRDIVKRAFMPDKQMREEGIERPLLTPDSEDSAAIAIAAGQLFDALAAIETVKRTLEWYANPVNYEKIDVPTNVGQDRGQMARVALAKLTE